MSQQKDNSGVLFREKEKKKPTSPDYTGNITVAGVDYWISGWIKESKNQQRKDPVTGKLVPAKFFSLAVREKKPKGDE